MPDSTDALVGVRFHHGSPPYEAGDIAGFPRAVADRYVGSGRASFVVPKAIPAADGDDPFAEMKRSEMLAYAREHLGLADAPPDTISDEEIRAGLRAAAADVAAPAPAPVPTPAATGASKA